MFYALQRHNATGAKRLFRFNGNLSLAKNSENELTVQSIDSHWKLWGNGDVNKAN
jgi:hypothetical protein